MQYLKDAPLLDRKGKAIEISVAESETDRPPTAANTMRKFLWLFCRTYQPSQWLTLETAEIRKLYKALDALEQEPPPHPGWVAMEDSYFELVKKTVLAVAPHSPFWAFHLPQLDTALGTLLPKLPEEEKADAPTNS